MKINETTNGRAACGSNGKHATQPLEPLAERLHEIKREINELAGEIVKESEEADKILSLAAWKAGELHSRTVRKAHWIGVRLQEVKSTLGKGRYGAWVSENFTGGESTARFYKQISKFENWQVIQPKLDRYEGISLEQARKFIRVAKPKLPVKFKNEARDLAARIESELRRWDPVVLYRVANNAGQFLPRLRTLAEDFADEVASKLRLGRPRKLDAKRFGKLRKEFFLPLDLQWVKQRHDEMAKRMKLLSPGETVSVRVYDETESVRVLRGKAAADYMTSKNPRTHPTPS